MLQNLLTNAQFPMLVALIIFLMAYALIISERVHRTVVALLGAVLMIVFQILNQEEALRHIDFNTIGLLIGMMIIVNILKRTGLFQFIAIKAAKMAKGDPWKIILFFAIITAVASGFLDNVTTVLLVAPVTFVITDTLKVNPIPFLIPEILAANLGGAATLIGDPPNIMIGGQTNLGFLDFIINLAPVVIVIFIVTIFILKLIYKKHLVVSDENKQKILLFDESKTISDYPLLYKSLIVLFITIIGFILHDVLVMETATVALFGATLLLLISRVDPEEILIEIEWTSIFFFIGLFVLVGGLVEVGIISQLADQMIQLTNGDLFIAAMIILWLSAIASSVLDNIPFVATMIPLIMEFQAGTGFTGASGNVLWWALSLGACLGGNGSLIGASANVIIGGMLHKNGHKLSFTKYLKIGFPLMILSIIISTIYLIVFYLI